MSFSSLHFPRSIKILTVLFLFGFFTVSCESLASSSSIKPTFSQFVASELRLDFGEEKYNLNIINFTTSKDGRFLVQFTKKDKVSGLGVGKFFRISADGGKTFGREYKLSESYFGSIDKSFGIEFYFLKDSIAATIRKRGDVFFAKQGSLLGDWDEPIRINDEVGVNPMSFQMQQTENGNIVSFWADHRTGVETLFSSYSRDGGKTWSPNKAVEHDFHNAKQQNPSLVLGANGRLHVFWQDWRDQKTLVDIRYSFSDDHGESWSLSAKINDDSEPVWQLDPSVIVSGNTVLVAFQDFREKGADADRDWNVYYSRSLDNGATWEPNKRLNDVKLGRQESPRLGVDTAGNIFCIWATTQDSLFRQIAFSYSSDGGGSWSPSMFLTESDNKTIKGHLFIRSFSENKLISGWSEESYGASRRVFSQIETSSDSTSKAQIESKPRVAVIPINYTVGKVLFEDNFSKGTAEKWENADGVWSVINEEYVGVLPEEKTFVSYAKLKEPGQYVLKGRFKLDKASHTNADIYFRTSANGLRYYVIKNRFRHGSWLSIKDNDLPNGLNILGGTPFKEKPFSFRSDRWYEFKLVVSSNQIDYYIDEKLFISNVGDLKLSKGKIGIGGWATSPAYFDDISLSELNNEASK